MNKKYPNAYFRIKPCRFCGSDFQPEAPSHLYCSPTCVDAAFASAYYERTYGIDIKQVEAIKIAQQEVCAICGGPGFLMDIKRHKRKLHVDHCHDTGVVRGLLCANCNRGIGLLQHSVENCLKAAEYLKSNTEGATTIPKGSKAEAKAA